MQRKSVEEGANEDGSDASNSRGAAKVIRYILWPLVWGWVRILFTWWAMFHLLRLTRGVEAAEAVMASYWPLLIVGAIGATIVIAFNGWRAYKKAQEKK